MANIRRRGYQTTGQAAADLGVSQTAVAAWCDNDVLDYVVTPAGWRLIPEKEVERMRKVLAQRTKGRRTA
jgi:predicted site-specific integrase-resolvase